jgi:hypothetical protein
MRSRRDILGNALAAIAFATSLGACRGESRDGDAVAAGAIVDGEISPASEDAVVYVGVALRRCTGTLISPHVVLTAFHCVQGTDVYATDNCVPGREDLFDPIDPRQVDVFVGSPLDPDRHYYVSSIVVGESRAFCNGDVALLVLDRKVIGIEPRVLRSDRVQVGDELRAVGWGRTGIGGYPEERRARSGIHVTHAGGGVALGPPRPGRLRAVLPYGEKEFVTYDGMCFGDSGGPVFDANGAIAGILSRLVGPDCQNTAFAFSEVSQHADLVAQALARAGDSP